MARLEAKSKLLYYPTPEAVTDTHYDYFIVKTNLRAHVLIRSPFDLATGERILQFSQPIIAAKMKEYLEKHAEIVKPAPVWAAFIEEYETDLEQYFDSEFERSHGN